MPLFRRKQAVEDRSQAPAAPAVDPSLPDNEWLAASERVFRETIDSYYGTPDTMASGGEQRAALGDAGVALLFYRKSIDMLHTAYGFSQMQSRSPSRADDPIIGGFCTALEESLRQHPQAPAAETVREVTHRLRSISTTCQREGLDDSLYRAALDRMAAIAPDIAVDDILWT